MNEELVEEGIVVKSENGFVDIKLLPNYACEECTAKIICKPKKDSSRILNVKNTCGVQKDDKVIISIPGKTLFAAALNLYFYPLIILVVNIIIGLNIFTNFHYTEVYAFLLGCIFLSVYYFIFFMISKNLKNKQPSINLSKSY